MYSCSAPEGVTFSANETNLTSNGIYFSPSYLEATYLEANISPSFSIDINVRYIYHDILIRRIYLAIYALKLI